MEIIKKYIYLVLYCLTENQQALAYLHIDEKKQNHLKNSGEIIRYLMSGVNTTLVNYISYFIFRSFFNIPLVYSNILAFIIAVHIAFLVNKFFVYRTFDCMIVKLWKEYVSFISLRFVSMFVETMLLYVLVKQFNMNEYFVKVLVSIIVTILNYIFGKFITFKKR